MSLANQIERPIHTKAPQGSELHNSVKCIFLNFTSAATDGATGTFSTTAYANVNLGFPVKEIIIKQIGWTDNSNNAPGINDIGIMTGDLVGGGVLGSFNASNGGSIQSGTPVNYIYYANPHVPLVQNVRNIFKTPKNIKGSYRFDIVDLYNAPFPAGGRTQAEAFLIVEFVAASGVVTDVST